VDEPPWHNKTVYATAALGEGRVSRLKHLCRHLNSQL